MTSSVNGIEQGRNRTGKPNEQSDAPRSNSEGISAPAEWKGNDLAENGQHKKGGAGGQAKPSGHPGGSIAGSGDCAVERTCNCGQCRPEDKGEVVAYRPPVHQAKKQHKRHKRCQQSSGDKAVDTREVISKTWHSHLTIIQRTIRSYIESRQSCTQTLSYEKVARFDATRSTREKPTPLGSATTGHACGVNSMRHAAHSRSSSASSMIFTPSFCALSSLEPASAPATT